MNGVIEADVLNNYNLNNLYNEWCHMKLTYHVLNNNVNKIDFVSPSADCSVVLWWGSLEGAIKTIIGTKIDFNTDEKRPAQEEELKDDVYEIIRSPGVQDKTYWDITVRRLGELDLSRRPVYQQLGVGGFTGWCVGNVFKKVGKVTALAIGGGLLMLQLASQSGYVTINWNKINKDMGKVSGNITEKIEEFTSSQEQQGEVARYLKKGGEVVKKNIVVASGFAGGCLLGLAT